MDYLELCTVLWDELNQHYPKELGEVLECPNLEYSYDFIGFIEQYEALSRLIPNHWTVIDFGCYVGVQAYYFRNHIKYIGVDPFQGPRLRTENSEYHQLSISDYFKLFKPEPGVNLPTSTFAICNFVPAYSGLIRESFPNLFIYYPESDKKYGPHVDIQKIFKNRRHAE